MLTEIRSKSETQKILANLIESIRIEFVNSEPLVVGIHKGGAWIASEICRNLKWMNPASLDISLYRDDFETNGLKLSGKTEGLPAQINGDRILLVDDLLYTGRTVRAALNVLFDYGRPGRIDLAILFDRGGRELPISPTFLGESLGAEGGRRCKLIGPEPLLLVTQNTG